MDTAPQPSRPRNRSAAAGAVLALGAAALAATGCGGSDTGSPSHASSSTAGAAVQSSGGTQSSGAAATAQQTVRSSDPVTRTSRKPVPARGVDGPNDEEGATGSKPQNPCRLVSRAEATAIVGRPVTKVTTAPQGPTCIYQLRGTRRTVTLTVTAMNVAAVRRQAHALSQVRIHGQPAYCVKLGTAMTFVPLPGGRALNVTAPCPMAASFVAKALPRVS